MGLVAGCGQVASHEPARPAVAGTVTFADAPGNPPNYVFPLLSLANDAPANPDGFVNLLYPPLYAFGVGDKPVVNTRRSLADLPTYSNGGRTVTIDLKPFRWSDGWPVTSRDVQFWQDLVTANKANWVGYVPGGYPDNVVRFRLIGPRRFTITFNRPYGRYWLLYNELSQLWAIPQHAWDRTSSGQPVGNADRTAAGARAVYHFLDAQARTLTTYASNPLWRVVDGPWRIATYAPSTGYLALVPNRHYAGPDRPHLARIEEIPFTSDSAEFDALRSGAIDYGYLPTQDLPQLSYLTHHGFQFRPWIGWEISYILFNFTNPREAPLFGQLYLRQAMQRLVDQPAWIRDILKGYGYATTGPVPTRPPSTFISPFESRIPYPYNPGSAIRLLREHGWRVHPDGVTICARGGSGAHSCGPGVARGAALDFTLLQASGNLAILQEMEAFKSELSRVGIQISIAQAPEGTVVADTAPCTRATGAGCSWDLSNWDIGADGSWLYGLDHYPTGGAIFASGAGANGGGYSDPHSDALISATHTSSSLSALYRYEDYLARQLPVLWIPNQDNYLTIIRSSLRGALPQNPFGTIEPQDWRFN